MENQTVRVAVFRTGCEFDYRVRTGESKVRTGMRVRVPLGRRQCVGLVLADDVRSAVSAEKLVDIGEVLDREPLLSEQTLSLLSWISTYYHYPFCHVLAQALPENLRKGGVVPPSREKYWRAIKSEESTVLLNRATRQRELYELLEAGDPVSEHQLGLAFRNWRPTLRALETKKLVCLAAQAALPLLLHKTKPRLTLNDEQNQALNAMRKNVGQFVCCVLEGITGSGKTELYLRLSENILSAGQQVLVLVPEVGLVAQVVKAFSAQYTCPVIPYHSQLSAGARMKAWKQAQGRSACVLVGTRSVVFLSMPKLGLVVVDEEHDLSYKQQDKLRYHARDVAIKRAQMQNVPVMLCSATPSLESLHNTQIGRYQHCALNKRHDGAYLPEVKVMDLRGCRLKGGISEGLFSEIEQSLAQEGQVLLFLNRRGYAPQMLCSQCGEVLFCEDCDSPLCFHRHDNILRCHHCHRTVRRPNRCVQCMANHFQVVGIGTERIEEVLKERFPSTNVIRIDADSTRRKGEFERRLSEVRAGLPCIMVGTQLLSKGHHLPGVILTGIVNVDQRLYSIDFRSMEKLGQLVTQVSGRAGRGKSPGKVVLQTYHPNHPQILKLLKKGYRNFALELLKERKAAELPPYRFFAAVNAASRQAALPLVFLSTVRNLLKELAGTQDFEMRGPVPAFMEKKAGRHRAQLLLIGQHRSELNCYLRQAVAHIRKMKKNKDLHWHIDVDPMEMI